jgi:hypothetical protein
VIYGVFYNDHLLVRDELVAVLHHYYCSLALLLVGAYPLDPLDLLEQLEPLTQPVIVACLEVGVDLHREDPLAQHPDAQGQRIQHLEDELCQDYLVPFYLYQLFLIQK